MDTAAASRALPSIATGALVAVAAAATPNVPGYAGPLLLGLAALAAWDRHWIWGALGAALVWVPALGGPVGSGVLAGAVLLGALRWRAVSTAVLLVGLVGAAKQGVAAGVLPEAVAPVGWLLVASVTLAGAASAARGGRAEAVGMALAGVIVLGRVGELHSVDGAARLAAAVRLGDVPAVYDDLVAGADPPLLVALVHAAPARDEAALALGWARALDEGWRPAKAEGVVVPVARALEARGRGGEALRLLARHPRTGEVDALRALLERTQGLPVHWQGAPLGPRLPGAFDPALVFETNGYAAVELTADDALPALVVEGIGTAYAGAPVLDVQLDAAAPIAWTLDGAASLRLEGPIAPGPHRVGFRFANDRADAAGDRNVRVTAVRGP
jgi:hypothetical protein